MSSKVSIQQVPRVLGEAPCDNVQEPAAGSPLRSGRCQTGPTGAWQHREAVLIACGEVSVQRAEQIRSNYIFCLMGKSATGKDTIYGKLRDMLAASGAPDVGEVIPYTTRPIRTGEENGVAYWFETQEQYDAAAESGKIIEARAYNTVHGIWRYYTKDDGQIDLTRRSYLVIGTLESYLSFCRYYGAERVVPFYIEVEDRERLRRAIHREDKQANPHYSEMCRRFLADEEDFSEEKLAAAGITRRFENTDSDACAAAILNEMKKRLG